MSLKDMKIDFDDPIRLAEKLCKKYKNSDVELILKSIIKKIENGEDIILKDGSVLKTEEEKMQFLKDELRRVIRHIAYLEHYNPYE